MGHITIKDRYAVVLVFFSKIIFFGTLTFIMAVEIIIRKYLTVFTIGAFEAR